MVEAIEALPSVGRAHVSISTTRRKMPGSAFASPGSPRVYTSLDPRPILAASRAPGAVQEEFDYVWIAGRGPFKVLDGSLDASGFSLALAQDSQTTANYSVEDASVADDDVAPEHGRTDWEVSSGG